VKILLQAKWVKRAPESSSALDVLLN